MGRLEEEGVCAKKKSSLRLSQVEQKQINLGQDGRGGDADSGHVVLREDQPRQTHTSFITYCPSIAIYQWEK